MQVNAEVQRLARVVGGGTSCAGKTTFARELAEAAGSSHIELNQLYWGPNWTPKPEAEFRGLLERAIPGQRWVVDGNYQAVQDLIWARATAIVWLNFGFGTVFGRALRRTVKRSLSRARLWGRNRESSRRAFLSRQSILRWVLTTCRERRRRYLALGASGTIPNLGWVELRRQSDRATFLSNIRSPAHLV